MPDFKLINRRPKLSSKTNKIAKKNAAYEMFCIGFVNNMIATKQKKLPTDTIAGRTRCLLVYFTLSLYINEEQGR